MPSIKEYNVKLNSLTNTRKMTRTMKMVAASKLRKGKDAPKMPGYHPSNLMFGTPDQVYDRIKAAQEACSFSEITILSNFGTMPYEVAVESTRLFAQEVLPELHKLSAPLHAAALPGLSPGS